MLSGIFVFLQPNIRISFFVSIMALQFSLLSYIVLLLSTVILSKPMQALNA